MGVARGRVGVYALAMKSRRFALPSVAFLICLAVPASSLASTTVGQSPPAGATGSADCSANSAHVTQTTVGTTNPYIATVSGVITKWKFQATTLPGSIALQTFTGDPNNNATFTPTGESATETPAESELNAFETRLPISSGQYVGLHAITASHGCYSSVTSPAFTDFGANPAPLVGGGPAMYGYALGMAATNVSAVIEPDADNDGYGDETQDGCPGKTTRQDDCVKPTVSITKQPSKKTSKTKAKFKFSSDDATATFTCRTDKKDFKPCSSPFKLSKLKKGKHVFVVEAVDANDNVSPSESYKWKVKKG
jgi:hypothetical protein